jgi:hypothetical protein
MRKILLAAILALSHASLFAQAVIIPSPVPAIAPNCMLQRNSANTAWICVSAVGISQPLTDGQPLIADSNDPTKILSFELAAIPPATTRTWTIPNANIIVPATIASLTENTFQGLQTLNAGLLTSTATVTGDVVISAGLIRTDSADGADTKYLQLAGGGRGGFPSGAMLELYGNEALGTGGQLRLMAGEIGVINFVTGTAFTRGTMYPSGGFSWGTVADPGQGNIAVSGSILADNGKRVLSVIDGFTGDTTMFLRADGSFAVPTGAFVAQLLQHEDLIQQLTAQVAELEKRLRDR